jgi:hypothetical protein
VLGGGRVCKAERCRDFEALRRLKTVDLMIL